MDNTLGSLIVITKVPFYLSSPTLLPLFLVVLPLLYSSFAILAGPLRKIPGPLLAKYTKLWLVFVTHKRMRHSHDLELHKTYGPVVRVGPNQLLLSYPSAVKMVYGTQFRPQLL